VRFLKNSQQPRAQTKCPLRAKHTQFIAAKVSTSGILLTLMMPIVG
jgi:hypothetical protein